MNNTNTAEIQQALNAKAAELQAAFPGVTFGYLGNCGFDRSGEFDDRTWSIFLPHPGRVGTYADRVGGYATAELGSMLADWSKLCATVRARMAA